LNVWKLWGYEVVFLYTRLLSQLSQLGRFIKRVNA
jgi:hypothetical protein